MAVDAIRLLQEAEQFAEQQNTKAEAEKKQLMQESHERLSAFQKELAEKEREAQLAIKEKIATEFEQSKQPLVLKTKEEVDTLRKISDELKEQALAIIINKVVT
jgi:V/A-type H+-transporting ATPase subunit G/H